MGSVPTKHYSSFTLLFASITILLTAGCATIFTGTTDTINFSSNVDPVRVYVDGRLIGETPLKASINRQIGQGPRIKFEKKGYGTQEFYLEKQFNWVSILDITAILTSGGIDVLSGAVLKYSRNRYHVEMIPDSHTSLIDRQRQIKFAHYVLLNANNIRRDLAKDGGEYSSSLASLAMPEKSSPSAFESWLLRRQLLISAANPELLLQELRQSHLTP
jgi:hypothetical protein